MKPFQVQSIPIHLKLRNALGHEISVEVTGETLLTALAHFGSRGWVCGAGVPGGIELPLMMFPVFNFAMIGASQPFTVNQKDGDKLAVRQLGQTYYHRFSTENTKKHLPAALWFSRGARQSDSAQYKEVSGEFEYVPLIHFKGGGRITQALRVWCLPDTVDEQGNIIKPVHQLPGKEQQQLQQAIEEAQSFQRSLQQSRPSSRPGASA